MSLAPYAVHRASSRGRKLPEPESEDRSPFQRDRDRVVHSSAFRKLQYKTQVFVSREGDFYRTRLTHSLEVAQIARSIARRLHLDEDLTEALALAHDLGHPPFGHAGETGLNDALHAHGGFDHNAQSLRVVTLLEHRYAAFDGLNLSWEALEGLAKHNGPLLNPPAYIAAFDATYSLNLHKHPSAEAQIAAIADDMAYNAHDLDDGLRAGLFTFDDILHLPLIGDTLRRAQTLTSEPSRIRHEMIRAFINEVITDATATTRTNIAALAPADSDAIRNAGHPVAALSPDMAAATAEIKKFLFANMYRHWRVNRMSHKAKIVTRELGTLLLERPYLLPGEWRAKAGAPHSATAAEIVRDYVAGMTDGYAMQEYARLTDPSVPA
jgi:dGTPase